MKLIQHSQDDLIYHVSTHINRNSLLFPSALVWLYKNYSLINHFPLLNIASSLVFQYFIIHEWENWKLSVTLCYVIIMIIEVGVSLSNCLKIKNITIKPHVSHWNLKFNSYLFLPWFWIIKICNWKRDSQLIILRYKY